MTEMDESKEALLNGAPDVDSTQCDECLHKFKNNKRLGREERSALLGELEGNTEMTLNRICSLFLPKSLEDFKQQNESDQQELRTAYVAKHASKLAASAEDGEDKVDDDGGEDDLPPLNPRPPWEFDNRSLFDRLPDGVEIRTPVYLRDIVGTLEQAAREGRRVKAMGTQYSFSDTTLTDGFLIDMNHSMRRLGLTIDPETLTDDGSTELAAGNLVSVQAGASWEEINEHLWPAEKRGSDTSEDGTPYKVVLDHPGYLQLSIGGSLSVAANGSGRYSVADMVRAIHLVTIEGKDGGEDGDAVVKQYQIEPENGMSDSDKFHSDGRNEGIELRQDDALFHAVIVSMGMMGVIYSLVIKVENAFYVREDRRIFDLDPPTGFFSSNCCGPAKEDDFSAETLQEVYDQLDDPARDMFSYEIWVNPYPVLGRHRIVLGPKYYHKGDPPEDLDPGRGLGITGPVWLAQTAGAIISYVASDPGLSWLVPLILDVSLMNVITPGGSDGKGVVLAVPDARNFGSANGVPPKVSGIFIDANKPETAIDAVNTTIATVDELERRTACCSCGVFGWCTCCRREQLVTGPFSLRWCSGAFGTLATQFDQGRTALVEMPIPHKTPGADDTLSVWRKRMIQAYNGRPHWGLANSLTRADIESVFAADDVDAFVGVLAQFNAHKLFSNAFTESSGFDALVAERLARDA